MDSSGAVKLSCCRRKPYRCPDSCQVWGPGLVIRRCLPSQVERYVASMCSCTLEHLRSECRPFCASKEEMLDCLSCLTACALICRSCVDPAEIAVQSGQTSTNEWPKPRRLQPLLDHTILMAKKQSPIIPSLQDKIRIVLPIQSAHCVHTLAAEVHLLIHALAAWQPSLMSLVG